jgi:phosphoglycolate phosphatase
MAHKTTTLDGVRLVIYDFDGTLGDSFPWVLSILDEMADDYGFPHVTAGDVERMRNLNPIQIARHFGVPIWRVPRIGADVQRRMAADIGEIPLYEGVPEMLRTLADHDVLLAVVSSNAESNVRAVLGSELSSLIRIFEGGVALFGKAPRLRHVMAKCGVAPAHSLYVGDEIRDIEAAHAAGAMAGAVTWGYNDEDALRAAAPTVVFHTVEEIVTFVLDASIP